MVWSTIADLRTQGTSQLFELAYYDNIFLNKLVYLFLKKNFTIAFPIWLVIQIVEGQNSQTRLPGAVPQPLFYFNSLG